MASVAQAYGELHIDAETADPTPAKKGSIIEKFKKEKDLTPKMEKESTLGKLKKILSKGRSHQNTSPVQKREHPAYKKQSEGRAEDATEADLGGSHG